MAVNCPLHTSAGKGKIRKDVGRGVNHFPDEIDAAVNLSFSFRTPSR